MRHQIRYQIWLRAFEETRSQQYNVTQGLLGEIPRVAECGNSNMWSARNEMILKKINEIRVVSIMWMRCALLYHRKVNSKLTEHLNG